MRSVACAARITAAGVALAVLALPEPIVAQGQGVAFYTIDDRTIDGLLVSARQPSSAAVVLVPMMGRPKEDWHTVAQELAANGITALAIDAPQAPPGGPAGGQEDVLAAAEYLRVQPAIGATAIGVLGASLGATVAVAAAAEEATIRAAVLVSPALDYRGIRIEEPFGRYGVRPALLIASVHDPYAVRTVRTLAQSAGGIRDLRWSDAEAHGTTLLARDPDLVRHVVEWLRFALGVH